MLVIHDNESIWVARVVRAGHKRVEDQAKWVKCRSYERERVGEYLKTWSVKRTKKRSLHIIYSCEDLLDVFQRELFLG